MGKYTVLVSKTAQKQLNKLPDNIATPLIEAIGSLADEPRPHGCKKLKGREAYRIRKGNYRVIYEVNDGILTVEVIAIGHRKDIYE